MALTCRYQKNGDGRFIEILPISPALDTQTQWRRNLGHLKWEGARSAWLKF